MMRFWLIILGLLVAIVLMVWGALTAVANNWDETLVAGLCLVLGGAVGAGARLALEWWDA